MKEKRKERKHKKKDKKSKRRKERPVSSSSSSSESDEWVEQQKESTSQSNMTSGKSRDNWMAMTGVISTYTKNDIKTEKKAKEKKHIDSYNPSTSVRELNPYWKDGGTGLPKTSQEIKESKPFQKPSNEEDFYKCSQSKLKRPANDDDYYRSSSRTKSHHNSSNNQSDKFRKYSERDKRDDYYSASHSSRSYKKPSNYEDDYGLKSKSDKRYVKLEDEYKQASSGWKKQNEPSSKSMNNRDISPTPKREKPLADKETVETKPPTENDKYLSDEKMNKLAAKILKAEIMGDTELINKLKTKLEEARIYRKENPDAGKLVEEPENIMLMATNSKGDYRPLTRSGNVEDPRSKGGKRKAETHSAGERMKYFSNDDKHSLSQMFEEEKYGTNYDDDAQLAEIAAKHTNPNDDLEDIFTEEISKNVNRGKEDEKAKQRAIKEHVKLEKSLEGCEHCVGSQSMMKHLMISCGNKVYLAVPSRRSLTKGHCIITTVQHATCVTALDEDVWEEILNFRKALVNFFNSQDQDVVFFETAVRLHKYPHMVINCVPMPRDVGDTAPIYFKKALLECEAEWAVNKKVVDLKGKNIRKGIPKGLPYFWIDFGMDPGFAHVIEDQQLFPNNFAEEIIGGILDLDHHLWKRPQKEQGDELRRKVSEFVQMWKKFDTVSKNKL